MKSPRSSSTSSHRGLKICCGVAAVTLIVVSAVLLTLWFTVFRPKEPEITAHPIGIENMQISVNTSVTLDMVITINNKKNYGSFKFKNSTAYVNYHGDVVAEVPIGQNLVPARGKINITSTTDLMVGKIISNPNFLNDIISGSLDLTSTTSIHGRVSLFKILKMRATALSSCEISFFVASREVHSMCKSKIKL